EPVQRVLVRRVHPHLGDLTVADAVGDGGGQHDFLAIEVGQSHVLLDDRALIQLAEMHVGELDPDLRHPAQETEYLVAAGVCAGQRVVPGNAPHDVRVQQLIADLADFTRLEVLVHGKNDVDVGHRHGSSRMCGAGLGLAYGSAYRDADPGIGSS